MEFQQQAEQLLNLTFTNDNPNQIAAIPTTEETVESIKYGTLKIDMEMWDIYYSYYYVSRLHDTTIMFWISKEEVMLVSAQW